MSIGSLFSKEREELAELFRTDESINAETVFISPNQKTKSTLIPESDVILVFLEDQLVVYSERVLKKTVSGRISKLRNELIKQVKDSGLKLRINIIRSSCYYDFTVVRQGYFNLITE